ncbi:MAG: LemA family protein, partial [Longimonas sp.]|uniref:LemA family protein n=1 Tax=Longimonas sp. TaxID=2039626 RepID=UPI003352DB91
NVSPSPTDGVAYGLTELEGTVERIESERPLVSPVTKTPCVCYTHVVHHKEDSKSKSDTRTQEGVDFWCRDKSGRIRVAPQEAEIYGTQQTQKQIGEETHVETIIVPGEVVYVMGTAQIDRDTHEALVIGPDTTDDAVPFVVSAEPADVLKRRFAVWGAGLLNLGIWATTVAGIWGTSMLLPVGPSMYLSIAGLSIAYLFVVMGIIYYNDFVFLKQRVERNESNIEVALQKRYDLIRNLASTVQQYIGHERSIQEVLAELRGWHNAEGVHNNEVHSGTTACKKLLALVEDTPALKADTLIQTLIESRESVENDIAFMRTGYNDAVERYNTRIRHVPEVLVAKTFRFRALPWLS